MKDGGPAFPIPNSTDMDGYVYAPDARGMTLRDWFAGQALTAAGALGGPHPDDVTQWAYTIADAMLKEREK